VLGYFSDTNVWVALNFAGHPHNQWLKLAALPTSSPKAWMDAYLAAFAIRAGLSFATLDGAFQRYEVAGLDLRLLS
jgi:predicted nucleic acid-binding protein